ncbi:GIY-YIG nuclease family protein [Chromatium okenii]|uniref:Uncharacterized protein n=1 Tax=Chromatium okenii TaxID=61644 RepID=A0A2S7XR22_9GAMM|nr:GIY-YIG nuclease family protein [Chromatium okenii]PQJ95882.1 hypothetical protein CXB77_08300 [Chromatium okenii]
METNNTLTLTPINGELRIRDIDLAERLGFADPRMIRKLIKSNKEKLSEFSVLKVATKNFGDQGGRPATEYYLDQNQAIFICMKSETDNAKSVQIEIVKIFSSHLQLLDVLRALDEFEVPDDLPNMYVYAIKEKSTGNIKLGISRDPKSRLRQLQTGNSSELELIAYRKAENRFQDEKDLQQLATDYHIRGEWFSPSALEVMQ